MPRTSPSPWIILACACLAILPVAGRSQGQVGRVLDEARAATRTAASFRAAEEDYFHDMDGAIALSPDEIKGRNTWVVWSGGNDRLWDHMTGYTFGALDFLKMLSSHPSQSVKREGRWKTLGVVNEPCFEA